MTKEEALLALSKYGDVQILKKEYVFTLLITGTGLSKWETYNQILHIATEYCANEFPMIEASRNNSEFFCLVSKPKINSEAKTHQP